LASGPIAQGEVVTIKGRRLGPPEAQLGAYIADRLQRDLGGTAVFFNGKPAPLLYASADTVIAIVPYSWDKSMTLAVFYDGQISNEVDLPKAEAALGIFHYEGTTQAIALNDNDGLNLLEPARLGKAVSIFVTGEGFERCDDSGKPCEAGASPTAYPPLGPSMPLYVALGSVYLTPAKVAMITPGVLRVDFLIPSIGAPTGEAVPVRVGFRIGPQYPSPAGVTIRIK
jgi:uncharacterized protein (TIGR03437 family)